MKAYKKAKTKLETKRKFPSKATPSLEPKIKASTTKKPTELRIKRRSQRNGAKARFW
jgi:hypothetical protein